MSINIYQMLIKTERQDEVREFLADWLIEQLEQPIVLETGQNSFFPFFENEFPSLFAVGRLHKDWVTVLHDSYEELGDLARSLSASFNTTVIDALGQSTADTYCLSVYEKGNQVRRFYCGEDSDGIEEAGQPLPFEKARFGRAIRLDDDFFDYNDMQDFCSHLGIDLLKDPAEMDGAWSIIKLAEQEPLTIKKNRQGWLGRLLQTFKQ